MFIIDTKVSLYDLRREINSIKSTMVKESHNIRQTVFREKKKVLAHFKNLRWL